MEKCAEKCEPEGMPKSEELSSLARERVEKFAKTILKVLSTYETSQDRDYNKWLGCSTAERVQKSVEYPLYEQAQACYAINKLIQRDCKKIIIRQYTGGERSSPNFQDIEVKRDVYESLLVSGKIFFEWKKMRCIASLYFLSNYSEANFLIAEKDTKKMQKFQIELRKFMHKNNYFKGEKIEFQPYARISFLKYPKLSWDSLILNKELKEEIQLNLIFVLKNKELCHKHNIPWRRGLLLAGIPGTGKTQLGRVLCNELEGTTVIWATCKAVQDVDKIKTLFEIARNFAPTLIVMEDLDFYGHDREFITNPIVGELLNQLDGSAPNDGIFVLATTNRPHLLDRALADRPSRFDVKLLFNPPEYEERREMVKLFMEGKIMRYNIDKDYIAKSTDKLTGSHIKEVINYAMLLALKEGQKSIEQGHIDKAIKKVRGKLEKEQPLMVS